MENKNKQTAVEWLYNHLFPNQLDGFSYDEWDKIDKAFEQAKEMEKQQIIETARFYFHERGKTTPEQYYNTEYAKTTNN